MSIGSDFSTLHVVCGCRGMRWPQGLLAALVAGDGLLLIQDAVWLAIAEATQALPAAIADVDVMVLEADLLARGLSDRPLHPGLRRGDDSSWVEASERHRRCIQWGAGG